MVNKAMRIGFIGAGKVGASLGKYMVERQKGTASERTEEKKEEVIELSGYYSRKPENAAWAAAFTESEAYDSCEALVGNSDIVFLTVPDDGIEQAAKELSEEVVRGKCICHCSGAKTSDAIGFLREKGAFVYSVHPLCAVSSKEFGYLALKDACFTVEGDEKYLYSMHNLFLSLGNKTEVIQPQMKAKYHMAAVFASNLVVGLYEEAAKLLQECGLSEEFAHTALLPLFGNNAQNIVENGTEEALTGPVERGDINTVKKHLQAATAENRQDSEAVREIYCLLSRTLLDIARRKNPKRDYEKLENVLLDRKEC